MGADNIDVPLSVQTIPSALYHYTTQTGLLGILAADAIWATKIHFLNDSSEYSLAFGLANELLNRQLARETNSKTRKKIQTLQDNLTMIERLNVCVCSFSTNGDLLSQWRAYGGTAGLSIGFQTKSLHQKSIEQDFSLAPCIYDRREQEYRVEQLIAQSLENDFNTTEMTPHPTEPTTLRVLWTGGDFAMKFARLAAVLKSDAFSEECEWRLISNSGVSVTKMHFRTSATMLIPYVDFDLGKQKTGYLQEIIVGPTVHSSLAAEATRSLLGKYDAGRRVTAISSNVPYRVR